MVKKEYQYILEKILNSQIISTPFEHIEINNFLSENHLQLLLSDNQIHFEEMNTDIELYHKLLNNKYKIQSFPGCVNTWDFNCSFKSRKN